MEFSGIVCISGVNDFKNKYEVEIECIIENYLLNIKKRKWRTGLGM